MLRICRDCGSRELLVRREGDQQMCRKCGSTRLALVRPAGFDLLGRSARPLRAAGPITRG